ncbi:ESX secretion-associated protein EspG [Saccharopolyspora rhizosphaerae]|uniref:ESX secretion-associated protein EspG n=1 Tax=Saccharopolyspora rhizosphaerae TaxID=2492662 RepID=A0A3R8Q3P8_9PSEU|nr:ESX secretion-associated protein EspG [Saccharopolyspora rhizosphaerae]RRO16240.1 ESX secretion-associated protein EspG [Saccharopolyspora rhizosphaerae]
MRPGAEAEPIHLSALEFDVVCEAAGLDERRHVVLDVPSPGSTYSKRAELVAGAWESLRHKRLAETKRDRVEVELADLLGLLDRPQRSIDGRIWADRSIRALACANGGEGLLTVVDGDVVELTPVRGGALAEAAVSVAGDVPPGPGRAVSLPNDVLRQAADAAGAGNPLGLTDELRILGITHDDAADVANMADGMGVRGQFGAEGNPGRGKPERAGRVVAFHDTGRGRYLHVVRRSGDGRAWSTLAPADNARLAEYVRDLLAEVWDDASANAPGAGLHPGLR